MKIVLTNKEQISKFIMVFRGVSGMNDIVSIRCSSDNFYLQAMDKAHSGIVEVKIMKGGSMSMNVAMTCALI